MLNALLGKLGQPLYLLIISMLPVIELRGGIPAGAVLNVPWYECYALCVLGNMIPVPFLILFSRPIFRWVKTTFLRPLIHKIEEKVDIRSQKIKKYQMLGLFTFVMIPLPGTGAWMGSLIAAALEMRLKNAFLCILAGVMAAGLIMTLLSYGTVAVFGG